MRARSAAPGIIPIDVAFDTAQALVKKSPSFRPELRPARGQAVLEPSTELLTVNNDNQRRLPENKKVRLFIDKRTGPQGMYQTRPGQMGPHWVLSQENFNTCAVLGATEGLRGVRKDVCLAD